MNKNELQTIKNIVPYYIDSNKMTVKRINL